MSLDPELLAQISANRDKLDACPVHRFECTMTPEEIRAAFGVRIRCVRCDGYMPLVEVFRYVQGYIAANGDPNDVWPKFND